MNVMIDLTCLPATILIKTAAFHFRCYVLFSWLVTHPSTHPYPYLLMATTNQTEQVYSREESAGVRVSPSSTIRCRLLAHSSCYHPFSLGTRRLQYALIDIRLGHVRYPWCMHRPLHENLTSYPAP